jgi:glyoxylase-like metal-dependent hydrolase (beta-lactamase superfamily II)
MKRLALLLPLLLASPLVADDHLRLEKVKEDIYVVRPLAGDNVAVSNAGFVVLPDRVLVFDTLSDRDLMREMMSCIIKITSKPVSLVALSHWHRDHTGGLDFFANRPFTMYTGPGTAARIVLDRADRRAFLAKKEKDTARLARRETDPVRLTALDKTLLDVRQEEAAVDRLAPIRPGIEVSDKMELSMGRQVNILSYAGPGHTEGDLLLHCVSAGVLFTGDLVSVQTVPNLADAHTEEWIRLLGSLDLSKVDVIVPGHGPVGTKEDVRALKSYLETLRSMVAPIAKDGSETDLVQKLRLPAPFDSWSAPELWFSGAQRVFREMRGFVSPSAPPPAAAKPPAPAGAQPRG